jgi:tripartite-type tricarboxylate transporter receptor subunit TctC
MIFAGFGQVQPFAKAGRLRVLAVTSPVRSPLAPQAPTVAESGLPGFEARSWFAILAPTGTSADIVNRLNTSIAKLLQAPEIREQLARQAADPMGGTPQQVKAFIKSEVSKFARIAADAGLRPE